MFMFNEHCSSWHVHHHHQYYLSLFAALSNENMFKATWTQNGLGPVVHAKPVILSSYVSFIDIVIVSASFQNKISIKSIEAEPGVIEVSSPVLPGASESSWWWNMIWLCYHYLSIYFIYHQIFIVKCCWWKKCCPWTVDQNSQKILWHNFIVSKIAKNISMAQFYGFPNSQTYFYNTILWFLFSFLFSTLTFLKQEIVRGVHYCRCQHLGKIL